jgi:glycosyltransferase involved in cell wall biosynthesis
MLDASFANSIARVNLRSSVTLTRFHSLMTHAPRWFTAIPMPYAEIEAFWSRDAGLLCLGLQAAGAEAKFLALGDPATAGNGRPLVLAPLEDWERADWWRRWQLDGVVLYAWALGRYARVAAAIRAAGTRLVAFVDEDGIRGPHVWFQRYLFLKTAAEREAGGLFPRTRALFKTLAARANPPWHYRGTVAHLQNADWIALQSPLARQRFNRFLAGIGATDLVERTVFLPHPVSPTMTWDSSATKEPLIVAVGRWETLQKNAPLLVQTLGQVLTRHPAWRARILGSGQKRIEALSRSLPATVRERLEITGPVEHQTLVAAHRAARISLNTSLYESFGIALAEALCCGCSVVGSAQIGSLHYFTSQRSGSLACDASSGAYGDALELEIEAWENGERDPAASSHLWGERLHSHRVGARLLQIASHGQATPCP